MTSVATRTSPVFRGKYVLSTFLNTPPPPAPPNVPTLDESNKATSTVPKTVRAQLELHRKNQPCAGCHSVIDPPGFALENFNSVGQWRDKDPDGAPLDVAALWRHRELLERTLGRGATRRRIAHAVRKVGYARGKIVGRLLRLGGWILGGFDAGTD